MIETVAKEFIQACRILRRKPLVAAIAVSILAVGIAVASAAFSALQAGLLNDLPYRDHDRLVLLHGTAVRTDTTEQWQTLSHSYEKIGFVARGTGDVPSGAALLEANTGLVSEQFFPMLGVNASGGRLFSDTDFHGSATAVAVLNESFATKQFGSAQNAIGQFLTVDGMARQVIGVLSTQRVPLPYSPIEVWLPLGNVRAQYADGIAVLRKSNTPASAQAEAAVIAKGLSRSGRPAMATVTGLKETIVKDSKLTLVLVMAATILLLIIICSNTASLMLVQLASREKEFAIRAALGANQVRLLRQLFGETLIIAGCAIVFAIPLSFWFIKSIEIIYPANMPRISEASVTGSVFAFILLAGTGTSVLISFVLFMVARHFASVSSLTERMIARRLSSRRGIFPFLVAGEIAITTVLLVGTGLLVESFIKLAPLTPGFEYADRVVIRLIMLDSRDPDSARTHLRSVLDEAQHHPGVRGLTAISELPLADTSWIPDVWIDGNLVGGRRSATFVHCRAAIGNFFQLMEIPLVEGRSFDESGHEPYAVVNQAFVQKFGHGKGMLNKNVTVDIDGKKVDFVVIGMIRNVRMFSSTTSVEPELYIPIDQLAIQRVSLIAQVHDTSRATVSGLQTAVEKSSGPNSVILAKPLKQILSEGVEAPRTRAIIFGIIAVIAVLLAAAGIYGILSWSIEVRAREIGIRTALGAQPRHIVALVLAQVLSITAIGVIAGITGALVAGRSLVALLYNTKSADPVTVGAASMIILGISVIASAIPARRAVRLDPLASLKSE